MDQALVDPDGVASSMVNAHDLVIGEVFVALRDLDDEPIWSSVLDMRSENVLRRIGCDSWAELSGHTVGSIWDVQAAGKLTVARILTAAAKRNAERALSSGIDLHTSQVAAGADSGTEIRPGFLQLNRVLREIAIWAVRERGASCIVDLVSLSTDLSRIPPELLSEFTRLSRRPLLDLIDETDWVLPRGLLEDFLQATGPGTRIVVARKIQLDDRPTLDELGRELGVSKERVRQIEFKASNAASAAILSDRFATIRWRALDLREALGLAVQEGSKLHKAAMKTATRGFRRPKECDPNDLMLWLAGPYRREDDWLVHADASLAGIYRQLEEQVSARLVLDTSDAGAILEAMGIVPQMAAALISCIPGWRRIDKQHLVRWTGSVGDKANVVFKLLGHPCTIDELNIHIGENHALGSLRNILSLNPRFVRLNKTGHFGLSEWGLEEYSGIAQEIIERIERNGGRVELEILVSELVEQFSISSNSVRLYARAPAFLLTEGRLQLRPIDQPYEADARIHNVSGLYVDPSGCVIMHDVVDRELHRGSGKALPEATAAALGIRPGERRDYSFEGEAKIVVSWPATSASGPTLGSVRLALRRLDLEVGESFRLVFDPHRQCCDATRVDPLSLDGLTGLTIPSGGELAVLAAALRVDVQSVRTHLHARGDDDVLNFLPEVEHSSELSEAILRFGELIG